MLHPIDLYVALKLATSPENTTYAELAHGLGLSSSQVHRAVKKAQSSGLVQPGSTRIDRRSLLELLVHGVRYVYPAKRGPVTRGVPTAHSAAPLRDMMTGSPQEFVWADPEGTIRGESVEPLHKQAPLATRKDPRLHEMLALVDAIRIGRARERKIAHKVLKERLSG